MSILNLAIIFIFSLVIGSFLNVVIYRAKIKKSVLAPRSFCPHCKHILSWRDLIPVASFILLRGKCRYCREKISPSYALVELSTGVLFVLFYLQAGSFNLALVFNLFFASILVVVFVYDLRYYLIIDNVILLGAIGAILASIFLGRLSFPQAILGSLAGGVFFAIIVLVSRGKWMGGGDVKLGFLLGLILGWPKILAALFLAFILGSIVGIFLVIRGKKKLKSAVPFGPFLAAATLVVMLWGDEILNWYLHLIIF